MQKQSHDNVILELTVRNHPGVMTHVCGLFARRAFNVEGILCLPIQGCLLYTSRYSLSESGVMTLTEPFRQ